MMCLHNMDEEYCKEWISSGTITLFKYRKIEQACLNGTQFLCTYVVYVQERMPTTMTHEMIAMAEFGCKSGNGVHCLILASIDNVDKEKHLDMGCKAGEGQACKKLATYRATPRKGADGKIKFDKQAFEKKMKDAFNKMLGHGGKKKK